MENCRICPRGCGADRKKGGKGYCRAPANPVVYSYDAHHGEEPPISGARGSGTIFFSGCNMKCVYCQNYYFSQLDAGKELSVDKLADIMISLQGAGCHNINLVNPTHFVPAITASLEKAVSLGLEIPIIYNTGGYDLVDTLKLLEGIIDIYLPDMRYSDNEMAKIYSDSPNYTEVNRAAVREMVRQTGNLMLDDDNIAVKGAIIRLLTLPENVSGLKDTLEFIKENIGEGAYLSIMSQYYPTYKAFGYRAISRGVTRDEYKNVVDYAKLLGLNNGWVQEEPLETDSRFFGTNIPPK